MKDLTVCLCCVLNQYGFFLAHRLHKYISCFVSLLHVQLLTMYVTVVKQNLIILSSVE